MGETITKPLVSKTGCRRNLHQNLEEDRGQKDSSKNELSLKEQNVGLSETNTEYIKEEKEGVTKIKEGIKSESSLREQGDGIILKMYTKEGHRCDHDQDPEEEKEVNGGPEDDVRTNASNKEQGDAACEVEDEHKGRHLNPNQSQREEGGDVNPGDDIKINFGCQEEQEVNMIDLDDNGRKNATDSNHKLNKKQQHEWLSEAKEESFNDSKKNEENKIDLTTENKIDVTDLGDQRTNSGSSKSRRRRRLGQYKRQECKDAGDDDKQQSPGYFNNSQKHRQNGKSSHCTVFAGDQSVLTDASASTRASKRRRYRKLDQYSRDPRWYPGKVKKEEDDEKEWYDTDSDLQETEQEAEYIPSEDVEESDWQEEDADYIPPVCVDN